MAVFRTGPRYPVPYIVERGKAFYEAARPTVETRENLGKIMVIDIETGEYEIDEDHMAAVDQIRARLDDPELYAVRIGYNAVESFGGWLRPIVQL